MIDIGWPEMLIIGVHAMIVVGHKDMQQEIPNHHNLDQQGADDGP